MQHTHHPSIVNVGLLASASHAFYTQPELRRNTTVISSTVGAALGLLAIEGYAAEKYRETPRGQEEERRARKEGSAIYKHSKEVILRPGVLGGLVGLGMSPGYPFLTIISSSISEYRHLGHSGLLFVHQLGQADMGQENSLCCVRRSPRFVGRRRVSNSFFCNILSDPRCSALAESYRKK